MKKTVIILLVIFFYLSAFSQQVSNWQTYSDMKTVRAIQSSSNSIWAASGGGGFGYYLNDISYKKITKTNGLQGTFLTAITVDQNGNLWFGSSDGIIDVYDVEQNSVESVLDIYNSEQTLKQINYLNSIGDTIIAATDFGVSLINTDNLLFFDTFFKFGDLPSYIKVNSAFKSNLLYACTDQGLAIQKPGAINLSAPESWNVYKTADGLLSDKVYKVINFNNSIIIATDKGMNVYNGNVFQPFLNNTFQGKDVIDIITQNDSLFILSENKIFSYSSDNLNEIYSANFSVNKLTYSDQLGLLAATNNGIVKVYNDDIQNRIYPDGPYANQFPDISVSPDGTFWSASGRDGAGVGFYKYDGNNWINFNKSNNSVLPTNDYNFAFTAPDNTAYLGAWGFGFAKVKNNNIEIFTADNTEIKGVDENPNYLIVSGLETDSKGNLWTLIFGAVDRNSLHMLTPDSTWYHFKVPSESNQYYEERYHLEIDQYDTKWYTIQDSRKRGLFYFNENNSPEDPSDDLSGYITTTSGLNDNLINSIVVDRRGDIWVGTNLGVNIITNNGTIFNSGIQQLRFFSVFALRQQSINCIAVDPLNRKWVGTNQGLFLVNSDGTSLITTFDSKNSPLLADRIRSIAIDDNSGRVYVGTDAGLTSFDTPAINPNENFSELFAYPNPFIVKTKDNMLTIDGLIRNSEIKILNISGKLIKELTTPGGRIAFWDGRDNNGQIVNSGVYLIVAYDEDGNNVSTTKVAVLRK